MTAQTTFATCLTILLIINGFMFFAGSPNYGDIAGITYVSFSLTNIISTLGGIVLIMLVATLNIFGSGVDAGIMRYVYGFAVLMAVMFQITFTINSQTITFGVGLLQNILYPFFNPSSVTVFSDVGLIVCSIFGMITLGSGLMLMGGN